MQAIIPNNPLKQALCKVAYGDYVAWTFRYNVRFCPLSVLKNIKCPLLVASGFAEQTHSSLEPSERVPFALSREREREKKKEKEKDKEKEKEKERERERKRAREGDTLLSPRGFLTSQSPSMEK